ncbi:hypothetical protein APR04_003995 [Promicromonospora umidemergens]|uniref:LPXTG-motif cell wall-anchored protein n=1 Tax=Promicromonospora umidemergens TaxID=629679 RepID=A0ABP8X1T8_9MICO|nr:hypothetical protein [Promicromonospora umidemergens]MCP2285068.1 hypothetical protein [Promicromonospora umidemergens]
MTSATASAATPRPTVRNAPARRPFQRVLLLALLTVLALTGTTAVGQRAAAAERSYDDIWVNADGVAFQRGSASDEVVYVVRPAGARRGGQAYSRDLTRDEQNHGWTTFWEAKRAYPDGYCVVWVEVEDASSWHASEGSTACTASRRTPPSTPTPTPAATKADKPAPVPVATPRPRPRPTPEAEQPQAAAPASTPSAAPAPTPSPTPTPTPTPTPSATPSPSGSSTPSPSPSRTSPDVALMQGMVEQQGNEAQAVPAGDGEVISPLGWVTVLGSGALLATGGLLLLWRRLT